MKKKEKTSGRASVSLCLVLSSSLFCLVSTYSRNVENIPFRYVVPFLLFFSILGLGVYGLSLMLLRHREKAALMTAWLMAIFCNFALLSRIFPDMKSGPLSVSFLLCAAAALVLSLILFFLLKKGKSETVQVPAFSFALVFSVLLFFNIVTAAVGGIRNFRSSGPSAATHESELLLRAAEEAEAEELPNVYFLLFDEYAGFDELEQYYGYDNSAFSDYLEQRGFTVGRGCSNDMLDTLYILADLNNLQFLHPHGYHEDQLRAQIAGGVWFDMLRSLGYTLYDTEGEAFTDLINPIPELRTIRVPTTQTGDSYIRVFLKNTAIYFLSDELESFFLKRPTAYPDAVNMIMDYYATAEFDDGPAFYYSYVCCPHGAFYFDREGNRIDDPNDPMENFNWIDPSFYLGQLEYVNLLIERAVDNILSQDPDCIIVLCSDHGARNHKEFGNSDVTDETALDILMAVYDRGEPFEGLDGMDGVNVLREIMNRTYGMTLPMLDYLDDGTLVETIGRRP